MKRHEGQDMARLLKGFSKDKITCTLLIGGGHTVSQIRIEELQDNGHTVGGNTIFPSTVYSTQVVYRRFRTSTRGVIPLSEIKAVEWMEPKTKEKQEAPKKKD